MQYLKAWRKWKAEALTDGGTDEFELPAEGILSNIEMMIKTKGASTQNNVGIIRQDYHLSQFKVEGTGDRTLFDIRGEQLSMLNAFDHKQFLPRMANEYGTRSSRYYYEIPFGRYRGDPDYALDLGAWKKVKLKITNGFDDTTRYTASNATIDIFLNMFQGDRPSAPEYLKTWEAETSKPSAAGQYVYYEYPADYVLRRAFFHPDADLNSTTGAPTNMPVGDSYTFKLTYNSGDKTAIDCRPKDMFRYNALKFGRFITHGVRDPDSTNYWDTQLGYVEHTQVTPNAETADATVSSTEDSQDRYQKLQFQGGGAILSWFNRGIAPMNAWVMDYDEWNDPLKWLNVAEVEEAEMEWYGYAADHTARVVYQAPQPQGQA